MTHAVSDGFPIKYLHMLSIFEVPNRIKDGFSNIFYIFEDCSPFNYKFHLD